VCDYVSSWPDFQIHISDAYANGEVVILVARTTGSCDRLSRGEEIRGRRIYSAKVVNGRVDEFRYTEEDTPKQREALGVTSASRITS
jgi:hypothetical protein